MVERGMELPSPFAGRYEILRELGHGGSAVVYLVHDRQHDREVALKVLSPDYASALGPSRFLREIRLVSRLQHPYIVPVLDSGESEGRLYFVMPLVEGQPLRTRMTREGQLPIADAVRYATEIADALQHAHEHGVLHRDVKPENILLSGQHACLADFGIARALTPATGDEITTTGVILGTPSYMSPEQASSEKAIDGRSDQYALGCVLFEMLAGMPPFVGANEQSVITQRFHHAAPRVSQYRPAVGRMLDDAVARALQMVPADRFSSLGAFAEALRRAMETPSMEEMRAVDARPASTRTQRRWLVGATTLAVVSTIALAAWWLLTGDGQALAAGSAASLIAEPGPNVNRGAAAAYQAARAQFAVGRLDSAEIQFARAAAIDPTFALAWLWQAQLIQWRTDGRDGGDWSVQALRATRSKGQLSTRDTHHAQALLALSEQRFEDACREFGQVVRADSLSFVGSFGMGECRRLDREVVRDTLSPSGWRFRAELSEAIASYTQALAFAPGQSTAGVLRRALHVFYSEASFVRQGRESSSRTGFSAYPELVDDTIAFVPFPNHQMAALERATAPRSRGAALQRSREMELAFTRRWVRQMPSNVDALEALSLALESRGDLADSDSRTPDALSVIREARRLSTDVRRGVLLQASEVRLLVKSSRFAEAGRLADSALGVGVARDSVAAVLAALASLQGNETRAAMHLRVVLTGEDAGRGELGMAVPTALAERLALLIAAVETGSCDQSHLDSLDLAVETLVATLEEPARRETVTAELLDDVRVQAAVCTNGSSTVKVRRQENLYARLVTAAARGDRASVRTLLSRFDAAREGWSRSHLSWDSVALECWALAAIGDVPGAAARLDGTLSGLAYSSNWLTTKHRIAGGFRRALHLRSRLAQQLGDSAAARRWRSALEELSGVSQ